MASGRGVPVWDIGIRIFHWALVVLVSIAEITCLILGRQTLAWHLLAGEAIVVLLGWRVVWGLLGTGPARFASFTHAPTAVLAHLRDLRHGAAHRHLGHNPLGAMMVFALIIVLAVISLTGAITLGGMLKQGPLRGFLSYATGDAALDVHNALAILLLAMVAAHLAGVVFESWRGRENLVRAMVTGAKPALPPAALLPTVRAHPWRATAITLVLLAAGAAGVAGLAMIAPSGVPPAEPDAMFALQCGACHLAFPASLAPAATWDAILADPHHHFGADATISDEQTAQVKAWLDANSAEHWDTLPAHLLRIPATDGSRRITDTPGWRQRHQGIPAAVFTTKPVYRRSNCEACHTDAATGLFRPQDIAIPAQ